MRRALGTPIVVVAVAVAGAGVGFTRGGEPDLPPRSPAPSPTPAATAQPAPPSGPRALFASTCGTCHALHAAGVHGMIGPDLDALRPSAARARRAIRTGSLDGVMQPGLLRGRDARAVAAYVARATR
ncbi:MAG TPA: c-type cytochrome [Solirubrobacteraceae bacterium]|nr:c-type cytochrome [Solirubrobacteraceae bacterium]